MCVGQYTDLLVCVFVVVTTFYTMVCILSFIFRSVALQIVICPPPLTRGGKKTPAPCCHGTGVENFCGTTQIGALRPLCTHDHALRRDNGRGCRRLLLVAFRIALVRPFALSSPAAITPSAALLALPSGLLLLRIGLRCLLACNVPPSAVFVNGFYSARIYSLRRP